MSLKNFYTDNLKAHQNIKINSIEANDASFNTLSINNLNVEDLSANRIVCNDLSVNDLSVNRIVCNDLSLNKLNVKDISTNTISFISSIGPSTDLILNVYNEQFLEMNYEIYGISGTPVINGVLFVKMGRIVVMRQTYFGVIGNALTSGDPNIEVITSTFQIPINYRPENAQVLLGYSNCHEYYNDTEFNYISTYYYWGGGVSQIGLFKADNTIWRKAVNTRVEWFAREFSWITT